VISRLTTFHDLRAIPVIQGFVRQTGRFFGANETEAQHLELAAEEAASFILNAFRPDPTELFAIACEPVEKGLLFRFRNRGIPVDEENLPVYDRHDPEKCLEGLPFFLLESLTDSFCLKNEGCNGWVLVFRKELADFRPPELQKPPDDSDLEYHAREKLQVSLATPSDAYDIVKLTYLTYRYSYAKTVFYYRETLQEAIAEGSVVAFVAKNEEGEVVVNSSYLRSPSCPEIAEAGMLMSRPEYRKNRALLRVSRMQTRYLQQGESNLRVAFANLVTAHTRSQKLAHAFHFVPLALKISVHDQAEYIGIDTCTRRRESLLYALSAPGGLPPSVIHLPSCHHGIAGALIGGFEALRLSSETQQPNRAVSGVKLNRSERDRTATIVFEHIGRDWLTRLHHLLRELDADGYITIYLHLPADRPLPPSLESSLRRHDFFFSGIVIRTMNKWNLLYTALQGQRFDFDAISLGHARSCELRDYMRHAYEIMEATV